MYFLLHVFLVSAFSTVVSSQCLPTFQFHGESCYKIMGLNATWIEAKHYCEVMGADLIKIESKEEETFIETELRKLHGGNIGPENYWMDGADFMEEGIFRWMTTDGGSYPISGYTNWSPGQPDNAGNTENCLEIRYTFNVSWNDYVCSKKENFICETSAEPDGSHAIIG